MPVINSGGFQFYDPTVHKPMDNFYESPLYDWAAELDRQAYYGNVLGREGLLGMDNRSDFARSLYNRFDQGWGAARIDNPDLTWTDYLNQYRGRFRDVELSMDDSSRGINRSQWTGGTRWLPRSR